MHIKELEKTLIEAGCNTDYFSIGPCGSKSDLFCLEKINNKWQVYYSERGIKHQPEFESTDEAQACEYYYNKISAIEHWHIVGMFEDEKSAKKLEQVLKEIGVKVIINDSPALKVGSAYLKRVFVVGEDIFKVREIYQHLPLENV